ncbi:ankyrin repeat domain-containing protein [Arthrobacter sp. AG367]|uniref:ankyrin repeat domain-containing protein n=1 Tax=Arthrobacter sp. AG367 TaxID=2572909 RepID=UPI0037C07434
MAVCPYRPEVEVFLDPAGRSPLHYAALTDAAAEVTRLIAAGESPDSADRQGFTPLHLASQEYALNAGTAPAFVDSGS